MNKKFVMTKAVVFAGLLSIPTASPQGNSSAFFTRKRVEDPRARILQTFFVRYQCPAAQFVDVFLSAADENALDWRLLPSISIIESGGGKAAFNNNIFGWDGGHIVFKSIPHGIRTVAQVLSKSDLYRHKTTDGILRLYNPYPDYSPRVKAVMRSLGPVNVDALASLN